jgi:DNA-directed RNA polymerase specialized sigma24 family protein
MNLPKNTFRKFKAGDPKAMDDVFQAFRRIVFFLITTILASQKDINSAYEATFQKAFQKKAEIQKSKDFQVFLFAIAKTEVTIRVEKTGTSLNLKSETSNDTSNPLDNLLPGSLSKKEKEVLGYRSAFQLSWKEISLLSGLPITEAKQAYFSAKKKVAKTSKIGKTNHQIRKSLFQKIDAISPLVLGFSKKEPRKVFAKPVAVFVVSGILLLALSSLWIYQANTPSPVHFINEQFTSFKDFALEAKSQEEQEKEGDLFLPDLSALSEDEKTYHLEGVEQQKNKDIWFLQANSTAKPVLQNRVAWVKLNKGEDFVLQFDRFFSLSATPLVWQNCDGYYSSDGVSSNYGASIFSPYYTSDMRSPLSETQFYLTQGDKNQPLASLQVPEEKGTSEDSDSQEKADVAAYNDVLRTKISLLKSKLLALYTKTYLG